MNNSNYELTFVQFMVTYSAYCKTDANLKLLMTDLRIIKTEANFKRTLKRLAEIFNAKSGAPQIDELEIFGLMVVEY